MDLNGLIYNGLTQKLLDGCGSCAIGCSANVMRKLDKWIKEYKKICEFDKQTDDFKRFIFGFLPYLARLEGFGPRTSVNLANNVLTYADDPANQVKWPSLKKVKSFVAYVRQENGDFDLETRNSLWKTIDEDLAAYAYDSSRNWPAYYKNNLLIYVKFIRQHNIYYTVYGVGDLGCILFDKYLILKLNYIESADGSDNTLWWSDFDVDCTDSDNFKIDQAGIQRGGFIAAFWVFENKELLPQDALDATPEKGTEILSGYVNNKSVYSVRLYRADNNSRVGHLIRFGSITQKTISTSNCADLAFVVFAVFKDCHKYRMWFSIRFNIVTDEQLNIVGEEKDKAWQGPELNKDEVENVQLKFSPPAQTPKLYKNTKFSKELHDSIFKNTITQEKINQLITMTKSCNTPIPNCKYKVDKICTKCDSGYFKHNGGCVKPCPDGTYTDGDECKPCHGDCKKCTGAGNTNNKCQECNGNKVLQGNPNGNCQDACSNGYWPVNGVCKVCTTNCTTCKDATSCKICNIGYFNQEGQCKKPCDPGWWENSPNCTKCPTGCKLCSNGDTCTECIDVTNPAASKYYLNPIFNNKVLCKIDCPDGYYKDNLTKTCKKCIDNCKTCDNSVTCDKCVDSFYLLPEKKKCDTKCPDGTVKHEPTAACLPCTQGDKCITCLALLLDNCIKCKPAFFRKEISGKWKCVDECGDGYYYNAQKDCIPCVDKCKTCTSTSCSECVDSYNLLNGKTCPKDCPDGYIAVDGDCVKCTDTNCKKCKKTDNDYCTECLGNDLLYNGDCYQKCPDGTYKSSDTTCSDCMNGCKLCDVLATCKECDKANNWYMKNGACTKDCGSGYQEVNGICEACTKDFCHKCPVNRDTCTECKDPKFLLNNECKSGCGDEYYPTADRKCNPCKLHCWTCINGTNCSECKDPKVLQYNSATQENDCVPVCKDGWRDNGTRKCEECTNKTCKQCKNDPSKCTSCPNNQYLKDDSCVSDCGDKYYICGEQCSECRPECATCKRGTKCQTCIASHFLKKVQETDDEGDCDSKCPDGYFANDPANTCDPCTVNKCKKCSPVNTCLECKDEEGFKWLELNQCKPKCSVGYYDIIEAGIKKCKKCIDNCDECENGTSCDKCKSGMYVKNGSCTNDCGDGFVVDTLGINCIPCTGQGCKKCLNTDTSKCTRCPPGKWLHNHKCLSDCPDKTYEDPAATPQQECKPCNDADYCLQCNKPGFPCTKCQSPKLLENGKCIDGPNCNPGYCLNGDLCDTHNIPNCQICVKSGSDYICNACVKDYFIQDTTIKKECKNTCPVGKYPVNGECKPCSQYCEKCIDNTKCTKCNSSKVLHNDICIDSCPAGYSPFNGKCEKCDTAHCNECKSDVTKCDNCIDPKVLKGGNCEDDCGDRNFSNERICEPCGNKCIKCTDCNTCTKCDDGWHVNHDGTCVDDCPSNYVSINGKCEKCEDPECEICLADKKTCEKCLNNEVVLLNKCEPNCGKAFYQIGHKCNPCTSVTPFCNHCDNNQTCQGCTPPNKLYENKCIPTCPNDTYEDSGKCIDCSPHCADCNDGNSCNNCETFPIKYVLQGVNKCQLNCDPGWYEENGKCKQCPNTCKTCKSLTNCESCKATYFLENGSCIKPCSDGYNENTSDMTCEPCTVSGCKECPTTNNCTECKDGKFVLTSGSIKCVKPCPAGYYENGKVCSPCILNCDKCTNATTCEQCGSNSSNQPTSLWPQKDKCELTCPQRYTPVSQVCTHCTDPNCLLCPGNIGVCTLCDSVEPLLKQDQCEKDCGEKWFLPPGTKKCEQCDSSCKTCKDTKTNCTSCIAEAALQGNKCQPKCDPGYVEVNNVCEKCEVVHCNVCCENDKKHCKICKDGKFLMEKMASGKLVTTCVDDCGLFYYEDTNNECKSCIDNCEECNKLTPTKCDKCKSGWFKKPDGTCTQNCGSGFRSDSINRECVPCTDSNCHTCPNNKNKCTECKNDYFLLNDNCTKCIDDGYYKVVNNAAKNNGECKPCITGCDDCTNATDCQKCKDIGGGKYVLMILTNGTYKCQGECDDGYVANPSRKCEKCSVDKCKECEYPTRTNKCKICEDGYHHKLDTCVTDCGVGYILIVATNTCEKCTDAKCVKCSVPTNCNKCEQGYFVYEEKCYKPCPEGTTEVAATNTEPAKCEKCGIYDCKKCHRDASSKMICDECSSKDLHLNKCVDCPNDHYAENGICKPCSLHCAKCNNIKKCDKCKKVGEVQYNLHTQSNGDVVCIDKCESGYVQSNDTPYRCIKCQDTNATSCEPDDPIVSTDCKPPTKLYKGKCVMCTSKQYSDEKKCYDCPEKCATCDSTAKCNSCVPPAVLQGNKCQDECDDGHVAISSVCKPCTDSTNCQKCKENKDDCINCVNTHTLAHPSDTTNAGKCLPTCPSGFYKKARPDPNSCRNDCHPCLDNCIQCTDPTKCQKCKAGLVVSSDGKSCDAKCKDGEVDEGGVCKPCKNTKCQGCPNSTSNDCNKCDKNGTYPILHNNDCIKECPKGMHVYDDLQGNKKCKDCPTNCLDCTDQLNCKECKQPVSTLHYEGPSDTLGKCKPTCPDGYVKVNGVCIPCTDKDNCKICKTNLNDCLECKNKFLYLLRCQDCPDGTYSTTDPKRKCLPCTNNCAKCDSTKCNQCKSGYYFKENDPTQLCIPCNRCDFIVINNICKKCKPANCLGCVKTPAPDDNKCARCDEGYVLHLGQCIVRCPKGFYRWRNVCHSCIKHPSVYKNCEDCHVYNHRIICTYCKDGWFLKNKVCIQGECGSGYVKVTMERKCKPCLQNGCSRCDPNNTLNCFECGSGLMLYGGICVNYCPVGTFSIDQKNCTACSKDCLKCEASRCTSCKAGLVIKGGACVKECGDGSYLKNGKCEDCPGSGCKVCPQGVCKICKSSLVLNKDAGKCISPDSCPDGFYGDLASGFCRRCSASCKTCSAFDICKTCPSNLFLHNNKCIPTCPNHMTNLNGICVDCTDKTNCLRCAAENPGTCEICVANMVVHTGNCIPKCSGSLYLEVSNGVKSCKTCYSTCATCSEGGNATTHKCDTCAAGLVFLNGNCNTTCPAGNGLYREKCLTCLVSDCDLCDNTLRTCLTCKNNKPLLDGKCVSSCTGKFYLKGKECEECNFACAVCTGSSNNCSKCNNGYFLHGSECKKTCPDGYFGDCTDNVCKMCNSACATCNGTGADDCVTCSANFFRKNHSECVAANMCGSGYYADSTTKSCEECTVDFCKECNSKDTCTDCFPTFILNTEKTKCAEERIPARILEGPQYFSHYTYFKRHSSEIFAFAGIKPAKAVNSAYVSFSFWLRTMKSDLAHSGAFETAFWRTLNPPNTTPPIQKVKFVIRSYDGQTSTCELRSKTPEGEIFVLSTIPCNEKDLHDWTLFVVSIEKKVSGKANLNVTVRQANKPGTIPKYTDKKFKTTIPFNYSIITKDTRVEFNNQLLGDAFEIYNAYVYDYVPSADNVNEIWKLLPPDCDYLCETCKGCTCTKCLGPPVKDNKCQPALIPLMKGLESFNAGLKYSLHDARSAGKHFTSDEWGFDVWVYLDNKQEGYTSNVVNLLAIHHDAFFPLKAYSRSLLVFTVHDGYISINGKKQDNIRIKNNHWYGISYKVSPKEQVLYVERQDDNTEKGEAKTNVTDEIIRIYDDVQIFIGLKFTRFFTPADFSNGSIYNFNFYPNRAGDLLGFNPQQSLPTDCVKYAKDLKCYECKEGFSKTSAGLCVSETLGQTFNIQSKFSLWFKDSFTFPVANSIMSDESTFSFFLRKKAHSYVPSAAIVPLFSIKTPSGTFEPIVSMKFLTNFKTEYLFKGSTTPVLVLNDGEISGKWVFFVVKFNLKDNTVAISFRYENSTKTTNTSLAIAKPAEIKFGSGLAYNYNIEIAWVNYYSRHLTLATIAALHSKTPKDCDPSCLDCDYHSGNCRNCANGFVAYGKCNNFMKGFKFSYLYGVDDLSKLPNPSNWVYNVNDQFKKDVNSLNYSVIGYFKVYDYQAMIKNAGTYVFFRVGNSNVPGSPLSNPDNSLISFQADVTPTGVIFYFVVSNGINANHKIGVSSFVLTSQDWYVIYAAIDVKNKKFTYRIFNSKYQTTTNSEDTLSFRPQPLQEKGSLKLFGVDSAIGSGNKVPNGQFHNFYLNIQFGFDINFFNKYVQNVPKPANPICFANCILCVGVNPYFKGRNICAACKTNYTLNDDDKCIAKNDILEYGYYSFTDGHLRQNRKYEIKDNCFLGHKRATVGMYIRKNYHPENAATLRNFFTWGGFTIGIRSSTSVDEIVFKIAGKEMKLENFNGSGLWNYLSFRLTKNKVTGQLIGINSEIVSQHSITFTNWNKINNIVLDHLDHMIGLYSVNLFATSFLGARIEPQPTYDCSIDCEKCTDRGYCKQCMTGPSNVDGSCPENPVNFFNTEVLGSKAPDHFPIDDYTSKKNPLRTRTFTFTLKYQPDRSQTARRTVLRLNNLDHSGGAEDGVAHNYLVIYYEAPKTFIIRYYNRALLSGGSPKEINITLNGEPNNPEFFIAVSFNGANNKFGGLIYNHSNAFNKFGFTSIGNMDFLTNHAYLHLSDKNMPVAYFRQVKFFYEHILTIYRLWDMAVKSIKPIQYDCRYGTSRKCDNCRTGFIQSSICVIKLEKTITHLTPNRIHDFDQTSNRQVVTQSHNMTGDHLSSLSIMLWFKKTANEVLSTFTILKVKVGDNLLYHLKVDKDTLVGKGYANDKVNRVILSNLIDTRELTKEWIHCTVTYNFVQNVNSLHTFIEETNRTNFHENKGNTGFKVNIKSKALKLMFGDDSYFKFAISNFVFLQNHFTHQQEIFRFMTIEPTGCNQPCKKDCGEDNICPIADRVFDVSFKKMAVIPPTEIQKLPAFQSMRDVLSHYSYKSELNKFLVFVNVNVQTWLGYNINVNKDVLLVVSNDYHVKYYNRGQALPQSVIKNAILSIVNKGDDLVFYAGSNPQNSVVGEFTVSLGAFKLKQITQLLIAAIIDHDAKTLKLNFFADDLNILKDFILPTSPEKVNSDTGFYYHPAVKELKCQCYDPRFDVVLDKYVRNRNNWNLVQPSNLCNEPGETSCAKCVILPGETKTTCIQCSAGYSNLLGQCLPTKVCSNWTKLREWHNNFGAAEPGDADTDEDEE
ncbi:MAG: hypothetical protein GY861_03640 [bacterium]|nr:hypothetical protein [bacterium]